MDRMQRFMTMALLLSFSVHAVAIFGIKFVLPEIRRQFAEQPLEVVLVNQYTETTPSKAKVRAQENVDGGGNTDAKLHAASPLPVLNQQASVELQQQLSRQQQLEAQQQALMAKLRAGGLLAAPAKPSEQHDNTEAIRGQDKQPTQTARELSGLAGRIEQQVSAYEEKPRKAFLNTAATKALTAVWEDQWRQQVERIGTSTYPTDAAGNKLYGSLQLAVEINTDGSIRSSKVERSSGNRQLDNAALKILQRAAPFAPLPKGLRDDLGQPATVLVIVRTWTFARNNTLASTAAP
ncbi:energy transducer TonB [Jeongeupia naejangsanensis]|uniref:Energy transducer TonB n=1 Tax=Jeongeupia naejangsanensis TaxID=613195 RepID=A0ABS2BLS9_9NEIS|nr:energy transducer TonB [Jeongeupia naejangsanensis]MBM3116572.1 energy transducer TonB [Jeongeupia naejangsanensis]